jgi:hypothetical protein
MKNEIINSCWFGLREIAGDRRSVHIQYDGMHSRREDYESFTLSFFGYNPLFRVSTREAAERVLRQCPDWFQTSATSPAWGEVDPTTLEVVELEDAPEFKPAKTARPMVFADIVSTKCIAHGLCEEMLNRKLTPHYSWTIYVVQMPPGESLDTVKQRAEGATIHIGSVMLRVQAFCQAVLPAGAGQLTLITTSKNLNEGQA